MALQLRGHNAVAADDAARSRELLDALELAALFPARRRPETLRPIFPRA